LINRWCPVDDNLIHVDTVTLFRIFQDNPDRMIIVIQVVLPGNFMLPGPFGCGHSRCFVQRSINEEIQQQIFVFQCSIVLHTSAFNDKTFAFEIKAKVSFTICFKSLTTPTEIDLPYRVMPFECPLKFYGETAPPF